MSKKQQQRVKGNLKPSSSSKAAELLTGTVGTQPGFIGFGHLTPTEESQKTFSEEFFSANLDGEVKTLYRKLMKKDATTKLKALKELVEYVNEKSEEEVSCAFECWPRTFSKLSMDGNFKVRQLSHEVMGSFGAKLGKKLEKSIRTVFPFWLVGLQDPYVEVASSAHDGLAKTLPENREQESFEESLEARQARLSRCCLLILEHLTVTVDEKRLRILSASLEKHIWSVPKFWKSYSKHSDIGVRAAFFRAVRSWCNRMHEELQAHSQTVVSCVVNNLEESDKNLCSAVWDCWLLCLKHFDQKVWTEVNLEKSVLPKLIAVMRKGCSGSASVIAPCFLPVLSKIPVEMGSGGAEAYSRCITSLHSGLAVSLSSKPDENTLALILAFEDCIRFVFLQFLKYKDVETVGKLCDEEIKPAIEKMVRVKELGNGATSLIESIERLGEQHPEMSLVAENFLTGVRSRLLVLENETMGEELGSVVLNLVDSKMPMCRGLGVELFREFWKRFIENPTTESVEFLTPFTLGDRGKLLDVVAELREDVGVDHARRKLVTVLPDSKWSSSVQLIPVILSMGNLSEVLDELICLEALNVDFSLLTYVREHSSEEPVSEWCGSVGFESLWLRCVKSAVSNEFGDCSSLLTFFAGSGREILSNRLIEKTLDVIAEVLDSLERTAATEPCLKVLSKIASEVFKTKKNAASCPAGICLAKELFMIQCTIGQNLESETNRLLIGSWTAGCASLISSRKQDAEAKLIDDVSREIRFRLLDERRSFTELTSFFDCTKRFLLLWKDRCIPVLAQFLDSLLPNSEGWIGLEKDFGVDWQLMALCDSSCPLLIRESVMRDLPVGKSGKEFRLAQLVGFTVMLLKDFGCGKVETEAVDALLLRCCAVARWSLTELQQSNWGPNSLNDYAETILFQSILQFAQDLSSSESLRRMLDSAKDSGSAFVLLGLVFVMEALKDRHFDTIPCGEVRELIVTQSETETDGLLATLTGWILSTDLTEVEETVTKFLRGKEQFEGRLLFCRSLLDITWDDFMFNVQLIKVLCKLTPKLSLLKLELRDFLLCSLVTWFQSCAEMDLDDRREIVFVSLVCKLFNCTSSHVQTGGDGAESLRKEWNEFFLDGCSAVIVSLFFRTLPKIEKCCSYEGGILVRELSEAVTQVPDSHFTSDKIPVLLDPDLDEKRYPSHLQSVILSCVRLMIGEHRSGQIAGYEVLKRRMKEIFEWEMGQAAEADRDSSSSEDISSASDEQEKKPPLFLLSGLEHCYEKIGKFVASKRTDLEHEALGDLLGFFLIWDLVLDFYSWIETAKRPDYSSFLRSSLWLEKLVLTLFCVMPENTDRHNFNIRPKQRIGELVKEALKQFGSVEERDASLGQKEPENSCFAQPPQLTFRRNRAVCSAELDHLSCYVFCRLLTVFPAAVRQWRNAQGKNLASMIERFTVKFVSPVLLKQEFLSLSSSKKTFDNVTIVGRPAAREVVASYAMEELCMELVVQLPPNYPLDQPSVNVSQRVGIPEKNWRRWMLQLTVFLAHQNGSVLDGLLLWKKNVDKHLEGVEDCMICMMAVHVGNYSLPKIPCKQCKKKFHAVCLYKWFDTSNTTSCPLCRKNF